MSRTLRHLVTALAFVVVAGCGGGDGPDIRRFEASSIALPAGGQDVVFTWDVRGESSLELLPFPGAVSGTSATVTVTEETTFTLVARANGRRDRESLSITVGEPFTVNGIVLGYDGFPQSGVSVSIDGDVVLSADDGSFSFENVVPPYDLVVFGEMAGFGGGSFYDVEIFDDVTRPDPTVRWDTFAYYNEGYISGTLDGGIGFPLPAGPPFYGTHLTLLPVDGGRGFDFLLGETEDWGGYLGWWREDPTIPVDLHFLQYRLDANGRPDEYTGYATLTTNLTGAQSVTNVAVTLEDVGEITVGGGYQATWLEEPEVGAYFFFPGAGAEDTNRAIYLGGAAGTAGTYSTVLPDIEGSRYGSYFYGEDGNGWVERVRIAPEGETNVEMDLPLYPILVSPPEGATVAPGTEFSVASNPEMVNIFEFRPLSFFAGGGPYNAIVRVYTGRESAVMPDLSTLGLPLPGGYAFRWEVESIGRFDGVDAMLERGQYMMPASGDWVSSGVDDDRSFFTEGDDDDDAVIPF